MRISALLMCCCLAALSGCGGGGAAQTGVTLAATPTPAATPTAAALSNAALPVGDGNVSTSPQVGYVDSCTTTFGGGGSSAVNLPWVTGTTWDALTKVAVGGSVAWPSHAFTTSSSTSTLSASGNDLPNHVTGTFPIARTDPAYAYDQNPNSITAQTLSFAIPLNPVAAATPVCLGLGPIGFMLSGAELYDALDALGRDAEVHEEQDACGGHPDGSGTYHYHSLSACISDPGTGHSNLLGYAKDGFGIYGERGVDGSVLHDADLDVCHGHTHAVTWNGRTVSMYHYHATPEYPYTLGCYHGTPTR